MDKTLTNIGQKLDKTWTFVKKLSKFCLTHHSTGAPVSVLPATYSACAQGLGPLPQNPAGWLHSLEHFEN